MKILRVIDSLNPEIGGTVEAVLQSSTILLNNGHSVDVATNDNPAARFLLGSPIKIVALGPGKGVYGFNPDLSAWSGQKEYYPSGKPHQL